ncbi:hypothetical protein [Hyella patelloides]|uniref:hypothetical protein n=1 Tax=Hyella patelloides TaxID=1982969 RepID=UPI0011A671DA|nr:hypothetical protein [Hyella patelloides]
MTTGLFCLSQLFATEPGNESKGFDRNKDGDISKLERGCSTGQRSCCGLCCATSANLVTGRRKEREMQV